MIFVIGATLYLLAAFFMPDEESEDVNLQYQFILETTGFVGVLMMLASLGIFLSRYLP